MLRLVNRFGRRARRSQIAVCPRHDARMADAIARTIPKANANLAGSGFGATSPLLARDRCPDFRGANRERCVSYVTLRWLSKKASSAKKESRLTRIYPCRRQPVRSICRTRSLPQRSRGVLRAELKFSESRQGPRQAAHPASFAGTCLRRLARTHKSRLFGNRWLPQTTCADCAGSSRDFLLPSQPADRAHALVKVRAKAH